MPIIDVYRKAGLLLESYGRSRRELHFTRIYHLLFPWLCGYVRSVVGQGRIDPDEVACRVMASVFLFSRKYRYQGGAAFRAWIFVIVHNTVRKVYRYQNSFHRSLEEVAEPEDGGREDPARLHVVREEGQNCGRAYLLIVILCRHALSTVSCQERRALCWHHCAGLTFKEIGRLLGKPEGRVAGLIRRARKRISEQIVRTLGPWH